MIMISRRTNFIVFLKSQLLIFGQNITIKSLLKVETLKVSSVYVVPSLLIIKAVGWTNNEPKGSRTRGRSRIYGIFTVQGTGTVDSRSTGTGTIRNNGSWSMSLSQASLNISTWYYTFHLFPVPTWYRSHVV